MRTAAPRLTRGPESIGSKGDTWYVFYVRVSYRVTSRRADLIHSTTLNQQMRKRVERFRETDEDRAQSRATRRRHRKYYSADVLDEHASTENHIFKCTKRKSEECGSMDEPTGI